MRIRAVRPALLLALSLGVSCLGCAETLASVDQAAYDTSRELAPDHPVYGTPVFNMVSEADEIDQAQEVWQKLEAASRREGVAIDPPGERLDQIRAVFRRLLGVAHRQDLPWEVHLLDLPDVNAFTPGGGVVVVLDGLFGGLVEPGDPDELAAVLAHEIAHVTLLHVPTRATWTTFGAFAVEETKDQYYRAAYTTEQEAEADRIAALYLALAGFDPTAPSRIWERAHQESGSSEAKSRFLYDHPLDAQRMEATAEAAAQVAQYYTPGDQNPDWKDLLKSNALYQRAEQKEYSPGTGLGRAAGAALDTWSRHERARQEEERRKGMAEALQAIQIVRLWEEPTADGYQGVFMDVHNGTDTPVVEVAVDILYVNGQQLVATDDTCRVAVLIPAGQTARLGCYKRQVQGAAQVQARVADVDWQE